MNRKSALFLMVLAMIGIFLIAGCSGGGGGGSGDDSDVTLDPGDIEDDSGAGSDDGGDDDAAPVELTDRTVYVNPDDSMLYSFTSEDGEHFTYFGRRDQAGVPTLITSVEYTDAAGDLYFIYYDQNGLPAKLIAEDGTTLEFDYVLEEDTDGPAIELSALPIAQAIREIGATVTVPEENGPAVTSAIVPLKEDVLVAPDPTIADRFNEPMFGNVTIIVDKCGEPVRPGGEVWVNFRPLGYQGMTSHYPAIPMSYPGYYMTRIPQASEYTITPRDVENMCSSFSDALSTACSVFDPKKVGVAQAAMMTNPGVQTAICGEVAVAMSLAATPAAGAVAGGACAALLAGGTIACNTLGKSPPGFEEANYMDVLLCDQLEETGEAFNSATGFNRAAIQAMADFSNSLAPSMSVPGDDQSIKTSPVQEVSTYEPYPDLFISASDPTIDGISTVPGTPDSGEQYLVTVDFSCVSGRDLTISVRRDGAPLAHDSRYGDSDEKRISMSVPGSPPGSVDAIVVSVSDAVTGALLLQKHQTVELGEVQEDPTGESFTATVHIPRESISFNPINSSAGITQWITRQDAVGVVASEGSSEDSEFISITFNPNMVDGPGTYQLAPGEASAAIFLFASPEIKHANIGPPYGSMNVTFQATDGSVTITEWGTYVGDTVAGRFYARVTGTRITGKNQDGSVTTEDIVGDISGSFNQVIINTSR